MMQLEEMLPPIGGNGGRQRISARNFKTFQDLKYYNVFEKSVN